MTTHFNSVSVLLNYDLDLHSSPIFEPNICNHFFTPLLQSGLRLITFAETSPLSDSSKKSLLDFNSIHITLGSPNRSKFVRFFSSIFNFFPHIFTNSFFYVFLPGSVNLPLLLLLVLFRRPFAIYIRGDLYTSLSNLGKFCLNLVIKQSCFCITTNPSLVKYFSPFIHIELVVPMSTLAFKKRTSFKPCNLSSSFNILYVGQIINSKGIFDLIDAFSSLVMNNPTLDIYLTLVGSGSDVPRLNHLLQQHPLSSSINYLGHCSSDSELSELYSESSVLCLPTRFQEGIPRVLYEAFNHSCPVICSRAGDIAQIITDGYNGILLDNTSPTYISEAIQLLLDSPSLRTSIANNAHSSHNSYIDSFMYNSHGSQFLSNLNSLAD